MLGRLTGFRTVVFIVKTYYSERIQSKINQEKRYVGQSPEETKARQGAAKRQRSHQRFQQFQRIAGKNWSSELPSFLKEGSCRDVTPIDFP